MEGQRGRHVRPVEPAGELPVVETPPVKIETDRLTLRPLAMADVDDLVALGEDPEVTRFVDRLDRAAAVERVRSAEREWRERGAGMFVALDRGDDRFVGRVGLRYWPQFDETEIGWVLPRDDWGKGYATEAARAILDWAFASVDLAYITAMINPENAASLRVAGRLGMSELRRDVLVDEPVIVFSVDREDWTAD
jgi:RimJ/RimL family protein N-acetyltransferase